VIAAMVGGLLLLIAGLIFVWLLSPAFRHWTERPKFQMLERDALYGTGVGPGLRLATSRGTG